MSRVVHSGKKKTERHVGRNDEVVTVQRAPRVTHCLLITTQQQYATDISDCHPLSVKAVLIL